MNNGYSCTKNKNKTPCIFCSEYKRNKCIGAPETNLFRQDSKDSYELYYPLQKFINFLANIFMISTKDVLKSLFKALSLKIAL